MRQNTLEEFNGIHGRKEYDFSNPFVNNFKFLTTDNASYKLFVMDMADRIRQRMDEMGISQDALARQAGLTQPAIFKLLAGKSRRTTRLAEIAKTLKVRPEWLVTGEGPMLSDEVTADDLAIVHEIHTMFSDEEKPIARMSIMAMLPVLKAQLEMRRHATQEQKQESVSLARPKRIPHHPPHSQLGS